MLEFPYNYHMWIEEFSPTTAKFGVFLNKIGNLSCLLELSLTV